MANQSKHQIRNPQSCQKSVIRICKKICEEYSGPARADIKRGLNLLNGNGWYIRQNERQNGVAIATLNLFNIYPLHIKRLYFSELPEVAYESQWNLHGKSWNYEWNTYKQQIAKAIYAKSLKYNILILVSIQNKPSKELPIVN